MNKNISIAIACQIVAVVIFAVGGILNIIKGFLISGIIFIALSFLFLVLIIKYIKKIKSLDK